MADDRPGPAGERVVVALTGAPESERLIHRAAELAGRVGGEFVGVHVRPPGRRLDERAADRLSEHRRLVVSLGGHYYEVVGADVAAALVEFARREGATQLVLGAARRTRWTELVTGSVVTRVIRTASEIDVHVISTDQTPGTELVRRRSATSALPVARQVAGWAIALVGTAALTALLSAHRESFGDGTPYVLYQLVVVVAALVGGAWPAITAAGLGAGALNWYFSPPYHTWTVDNPDDVVALVAFTVVGVLVGLVVTALARRSNEARRGRAEAEALAHVTAGMVAAADPLPPTLERMRATLGVEGIALFARRDRTPVAAAGAATDPATDRAIPVGDSTIVLRGAVTPDGERMLRPFTAQLAATLERHRLRGEAERVAVLAEADRLRTALLRAVSHDLRSPLASIKASVTSLLQSDVAWSPAEEREFLSTVDEETDRLNRVIGNLLDAGRLEAGAMRPASRAIALDEVVASTLASISGLGTPVSVDVPADLPLVHADPALVERALANLITNADHASPDDAEIEVTARAEAGAIELRVTDHGPGLPEPQRAQMFLPFQRLGDRETGDGVGLGLAVAKGLIDAMNGRLLVHETPGGGLTMSVTLPTVGRT